MSGSGGGEQAGPAGIADEAMAQRLGGGNGGDHRVRRSPIITFLDGLSAAVIIESTCRHAESVTDQAAPGSNNKPGILA